MAFGNKTKPIEEKQEQVNPAGAGTDVAATEAKAGGAPAFLKGREQTGSGVSTKREDNQVPMVYVLQTNSPQVNKRGEDYIEGAEPGDLWMKNASRPVVKGEAGFEFQPCSFVTKFVEWIHRDDGGGFVEAYDEMPKEAKEVPDRKDAAKMVWAMPSGNYVKETKYYTGFARFNGVTMPFVIPLSSTGLTVSKQWMGLITSKMTDDGKIYDIWTSWYRVTTKLRKKKDNEWFVAVVHDLGFIEDENEDKRGKVLHEAVMSGEKKIDFSGEHAAGSEDHAGQAQSDRM
jgi:hypothetical protein